MRREILIFGILYFLCIIVFPLPVENLHCLTPSQSTVFKKREKIIDETEIMIHIMRSYYYNDIHLINYTMLMLQTINIIHYYYIMYSFAISLPLTSHVYYYFNHLLAKQPGLIFRKTS